MTSRRSTEISARGTIIGGTVEIADDGSPATGRFLDIAALTPDGREYQLGNATIENAAWGVLAG